LKNKFFNEKQVKFNDEDEFLVLVYNVTLLRMRPRASAENFSRGEGNGKRPKNSKKGQKIALLSLYLLYLYHVWKFRGHGPPANAHVCDCALL